VPNEEQEKNRRKGNHKYIEHRDKKKQKTPNTSKKTVKKQKHLSHSSARVLTIFCFYFFWAPLNHPMILNAVHFSRDVVSGTQTQVYTTQLY